MKEVVVSRTVRSPAATRVGAGWAGSLESRLRVAAWAGSLLVVGAFVAGLGYWLRVYVGQGHRDLGLLFAFLGLTAAVGLWLVLLASLVETRRLARMMGTTRRS